MSKCNRNKLKFWEVYKRVWHSQRVQRFLAANVINSSTQEDQAICNQDKTKHIHWQQVQRLAFRAVLQSKKASSFPNKTVRGAKTKNSFKFKNSLMETSIYKKTPFWGKRVLYRLVMNLKTTIVGHSIWWHQKKTWKSKR